MDFRTLAADQFHAVFGGEVDKSLANGFSVQRADFDDASALECSLNELHSGGQQTASVGFKRMFRAGVDNDFSGSLREGRNPAFARFHFCAVARNENGSDIFAAEDFFDDMRIFSAGNPEAFTCGVENIRTPELGFHAADRHAGVVGSVCHIPLFIGYSLNQRNAFSERAVGIRAHEPVDGRQDDCKVGAGHGGEEGGENIVVAEFQLINGNGVVFIDDRQNVLREKSFDTVECIQMTFARAEVVRRKQNLRGVEAEAFAFGFVDRHEADLTDCGESLDFREFARTLFESECAHSRSDCAG